MSNTFSTPSSSLRLALSLLAAVSIAACSGSASTPTSPSAASGSSALTSGSVAGSWRLVAVQPAGRAELAAPAGATYTMTLADDRVSLQVDCNACAGALAVGGQSLTIGPALACTRAACSTMAFELDYLPVVTGESAAQLSGSTLQLTSARGTVRFTR